MKYKNVELGEIASITKLSGFEFTKFFEYQDIAEIIAIRGLNVKNGNLDLENVKYIEKSVSEELKRSKLYINDIVITYTGSKYGDVAIITENDRFHLAPNVAKITMSEGCLPYFYYLYFQSFEFQRNIKNYGVGSGQPTIPMKNLRKIPVSFPPHDIQNKISNQLKLLNDKINLNNQMIDTLEEMASTLFKRWFVDFEFPDENGNPYKSSGGKIIDSELGEIPDGWEIKRLSEIANYKNGLAMQKFRPLENEDSLPVLKIKELNQGYTDRNSDRCSIDINEDVKIYDGDIIFSWSGTLIVDIWTGGNAGLNQHLFKVTSEKYPKWFYYLWTKFYLNKFIAIAKDKATTMGHIKRQHLNESLVCIPKDFEPLNQTLEGIINKVENLGKSNRDLEQTRDLLLPKLLSGEIEV